MIPAIRHYFTYTTSYSSVSLFPILLPKPVTENHMPYKIFCINFNAKVGVPFRGIYDNYCNYTSFIYEIVT